MHPATRGPAPNFDSVCDVTFERYAFFCRGYLLLVKSRTTRCACSIVSSLTAIPTLRFIFREREQELAD